MQRDNQKQTGIDNSQSLKPKSTQKAAQDHSKQRALQIPVSGSASQPQQAQGKDVVVGRKRTRKRKRPAIQQKSSMEGQTIDTTNTANMAAAKKKQSKQPRQYPFMRYEKDKIHFQVSQVKVGQETVDTFVTLKVTEKEFNDVSPYSSQLHREKTSEEIPQRSIDEIFQFEEQSLALQPREIQKFFRQRYFLFSKFDKGILIDKEGWYSVTPEPFAEYIAQRIQETFKPPNMQVSALDSYNQDQDQEENKRECQEQVNVLDAFGGVGGNMIQFAKRGYCVSVDNDPIKVNYMRHNAKIYDLVEHQDFQVVERDFLRLESYRQINLISDEQTSEENITCVRFPAENANKQFNAVFISPPWGGTGYQLMDEYALENIFPDFDSIIEKATDYSPNLMIFLPKNTSIDDLIQRLSKFQNKLLSDKRKAQLSDALANLGDGEGQQKLIGELSLEIESFTHHSQVSVIVVYTGQLAHVSTKEVVHAFIESQSQSMPGMSQGGGTSKGTSRGTSHAGSSASSVKSGASSNLGNQLDYIRAILGNVFSFAGCRHFIRFLKRSGKSKLSMQKVVKTLQKSFTPEEWYYYRKIHKRDKNYFLNKGGQKGDRGGGGWVAFDTKTSKSTTSRLSSKSGVSSIEETKSTNLVKDGSVKAMKHAAHRKTPNARMSKTYGRIRTLSNSEMSSSKGSNEEVVCSAAEAQSEDAESWTVSHEMLMINEVHTSEESEKESVAKIQGFELHNEVADSKMVSQGGEDSDSSWDKDEDEWTKVRPPRNHRNHIELKDLTEDDFLSMIEAKNQDKRFYSWLNFQPLFQGIETGDPTEEHERLLETEEMEEDQFLFFNDLFGLNLHDEEDVEMQVEAESQQP